MATLTGCPMDEDVLGPINKEAYINDLMTITPLLTTYNQGDEIIIKIEIPATNSYFGSEVNMLAQTNNFIARFETNFPLFYNTILDIKGYHTESNGFKDFFLIYNPVNQIYEIELNVKLNEIGVFDYTLGYQTIKILKKDGSAFIIHTSIVGIDKTQPYQFIVQ